jgi:hypothetical protein
MQLRQLFTTIAIITFFILAGYMLAASVSARSTMGTILALVSLFAAAVFMYLLPKVNEVEESRGDF